MNKNTIRKAGAISMMIIVYMLFFAIGFIAGTLVTTHYIVTQAINTMAVMDIHVNADIESNFTLNQTKLIEDMYKYKGEGK